ncbi:MAG: transglutaminase family protein [Myxococcota bacterium]|nr:transglutaminase family protein [Myxococcota bacterium]
MAIRVALNHRTLYRYDRPVTLSPQVVRLRPAPHCRTPVTSYSLRIEPEPHFLNWQQDPQSNWLARLVFPDPVRSFGFTVDLTAELSVINPFDFFLEESAERIPFSYDPWLEKELAPFLETLPVGPRLAAWLETVDRSEKPTADFLVSLNQRLSDEIQYLIRMEPGVQSCEETLERGSGSCRDTSWLLVQVLRHLGLAARFVSGYLIQLKPDVKALDGPSGADEDFTDLHAWAEVYLPGAGWVGLDPTSGLFAGEGHLPLAASPDPASAAPVTGAVGECEVEFEFDMRIERVHEDPRVTRPYTEETWRRIDQLGEQIDADLQHQDVRLTLGGEPTFVSADDVEGDEWNHAALGDDKRRLGERLLRRMQARLSPGSMLHFGQGKWYPGEPLPRWSLTCIGRRDGEPVWRDPKLLGGAARARGATPREAERFARRLAEQLSVDPGYAKPAFEDPIDHLRREGRLPVNVDPLDNQLEDPKERERMRRVFERGLGEPVGMVLPIRRIRGKSGPEWQSGLWMLRSQHLMLIPGDSPLGLRLPLDSLPWQDPEHADFEEPLDPMAPRGALPSIPVPAPRHTPPARVHAPGAGSVERVNEQRLAGEAPPDRAPRPGESADWVIRTALCVEAREGQLHVFLPPLYTADDYLELVARVEATARDLAMPVVLEGYPAPPDARLDRFSVTPDPGVLEVNVRPAESWRQLVEETTALYEDARQLRLATEKFDLDGRHTGTGGGNHVVLGGPTPSDSPLLRRPDLLKSLVGFWLDHPSLSYLFSGSFVGPTSQAPRIDEARHESVYELGIAFAQIPGPGDGDCPPWLVDRVFRHLLTDVTGNTHRAEFCIDKLYAPETATGRLGLLELRAFEMPPHARMSLTQQLLLRGLVAWFWREPYESALSQWGTTLHDRFLLPHFVDADFRSVLEGLRGAGYGFERAWFDAHFEFRFPKIGSVSPGGVELELRNAIEPWHVLGEEPGGGGNVRFVDSSLERVQVRVRGFDRDRHALTCNGRSVPLQPTDMQGEAVAGVRFRAWQPPSCLHPTIPVHAPLVFDLVDRRAGRSLGGCTYRVSHPGGRSYETFPVNAYEAEARRAVRFEPFGHTPGPMHVGEPERNPSFPHTLDLRRPEPR